jgi:hypothetical protein
MDLDKWQENDSDDEYDDEYVQNEVSPPTINEEFRNNVLNLKHILYDSTILKPEIGTVDAQSNNLLKEYLKNINQVYILSLNAQRGVVNESDLNKFPEKARAPLKQILMYLSEYFKKNSVADTIPYEYFINKSFKEYPFLQVDKSFE